nr:MAG TPA: hypothetical protein [Caudoviricetes sp.]
MISQPSFLCPKVFTKCSGTKILSQNYEHTIEYLSL